MTVWRTEKICIYIYVCEDIHYGTRDLFDETPSTVFWTRARKTIIVGQTRRNYFERIRFALGFVLLFMRLFPETRCYNLITS